jgi:uncharacterized protein (TIGR03435 family)
LADRFNLTLHRETKDLPVFALVVAKNGPKLHEVKAGDPPPPAGSPDIALNRGHIAIRAGMPVLVWTLSRSRDVDRVILDKTGLTGTYDFDLKWTPEGKGEDLSDSGPSIFTAIQQQLGLKLEPQKGPVEIIVIDHVQRPSEN